MSKKSSEHVYWGVVCLICLFVWALEIPVMVFSSFRELAQAQEVALVPLYQVLPVEFRHEPGLETNIPNSLGQFNPNITITAVI